ncbi:tetratricopeptide repeat protein [Lentzea alba]|uniref:AfsR/SARP family transcriptional regulator n=1 Tax=Lentzea alba TaxID=2714351 RepID=UPI0039BEFF7A
MEFRVLGPVEVLDRRGPVRLRAAKQRALLGVLIAYANSPVPQHLLEDALWEEKPPKTAVENLRLYVYHLRRALGDPHRIAHRPNGYALVVRPGELDADRFEMLTDRGTSALAAGDPRLAAGLLHEAHDLWHGPAYADLDHVGPLREEADRLAERRQVALEFRIEADLAMGRHAEVIGELTRLVAKHPLREHLCGLLMLALYRCGRQADALDVYRRTRAVLVDELGLEPGEELRRLEQAILSAEPHLTGTAPAPTGQQPNFDPQWTVPRQLPAHTPRFVGRSEQLRVLDALPGGIAVISGTAGVGKSALALHWAHQVADRFPDGQLYVNLRGFDPSTAPITPAEAVRGFLDAFGTPPERIPAGLDAQAALFRSLLADRRMLVVLDNAADAEQIRPLLPGGSECLVVVTSRSQLAGLTAQEGACPIPLDLLSPAESVALLAGRLGEERVGAEPGAAAELVDQCARLPLALAITAARAAVSQALPLHALCDELRDEQSGLDAFNLDDPATSLRTVFGWSYLRLSEPAARLFRLLSLHPGPDASFGAVVSLAGVVPQRARSLLRELAGFTLVTETVRDQFTQHDLLRAYATELVQDEETEDERRAATLRLLDHLLGLAHAAAVLLEPTREPIDTITEAPAGLTTADEALAWCESQHRTLMAAITFAAGHGFDDHAWRMSWAVADYLNRRGHWHDLLASQHVALSAATRAGNRCGQAHAHRELGRACIRLGRWDDAADHLAQALDAFGELGAETGQAHTHLTIGWMLEQQGRLRRSLRHAEQALTLYRACGNRAGQANALNAVGWCHVQLGEYERALPCCLQALEMLAGLGDRLGEAATWDSLGVAYRLFGDHAKAVAAFEHALELYRGIGDRYFEATVLVHLGEAGADARTARENWTRALAIFEDVRAPEADRLRELLR